MAYMPFGETLISQKNTSFAVPYLFTAKELDAETGLYYFGARYYDPNEGRWWGVDPLCEESYDISPYVYCNNNPVNRIDPDGRQSALPIELALETNKYRRLYNYVKYTLLGIGVAGSSKSVYNYYVDGDRSKEVFKALTAGVITQNAKASTPEQRREEKKRQEKSDHEDSNIAKKHAKSVKSNIGAPDSGGGSEPKRPLDEMKVAGVVLLGVGIAAELHESTSRPEPVEPIPTPEVKPIPVKPIEIPKVIPLTNN